MRIPTILAIDTSCDETALAVVHGRRILSNVLASQVELHKKYGGVYPIEAKRAHEEKIDDVITEAMTRGKVRWEEIDAIAVTQGPGLAPALEVGIRKAMELSEEYGKKLIAVNHMEGHLLSCLAQNSKGKGLYESNEMDVEEVRFPVLGLLVSGGHTELVRVDGIGTYEVLGKTMDDAAGECLDKVARMLGLGYPGGAIIEELAKEGNPKAIELPVPMKGKPGLEFSFSGLKTAALYEIRARQRGGDRTMPVGKEKLMEDVRWGRLEHLDREFICNMCASVQKVVIEAIIYKLKRALDEVSPSMVWLGGGVGANNELKKELRKVLKERDVGLGLPYSKVLWGDNAGMIGVAGYLKYMRGEFADAEKLDRRPRWELGKN